MMRAYDSNTQVPRGGYSDISGTGVERNGENVLKIRWVCSFDGLKRIRSAQFKQIKDEKNGKKSAQNDRGGTKLEKGTFVNVTTFCISE